MNARIDIITPAGKSLEGFPIETPNFTDMYSDVESILWLCNHDAPLSNPQLHPGDKIIIEVLQ